MMRPFATCHFAHPTDTFQYPLDYRDVMIKAGLSLLKGLWLAVLFPRLCIIISARQHGGRKQQQRLSTPSTPPHTPQVLQASAHTHLRPCPSTSTCCGSTVGETRTLCVNPNAGASRPSNSWTR